MQMSYEQLPFSCEWCNSKLGYRKVQKLLWSGKKLEIF